VNALPNDPVPPVISIDDPFNVCTIAFLQHRSLGRVVAPFTLRCMAPDPDLETVAAGQTEPELSECDVVGVSPGPDASAGWMTRRRRTLGAVLVVGALAVLGAAWTLASPVGAAPDDGFHLASIWCSPTAPDDACTNLGDAFAAGKDFVDVPAEIGPEAHCYAYDPYRSAACQGAIEPGTTVRALANDGIYPGLFHAVMGFAVGDEPVESVLLARLTSWAICVGFMAAGGFVLPRRHRAGFLLMLLVTAVPLAISLWTSTNPSGVVVASIVAAWCAVVALLHACRRREMLVAGGLLLASLVAAGGSRADGGLYAFVAVIAACILLWRPIRQMMATTLFVAIAAGAALLFSVVVSTRRFPSADRLFDQVDDAAAEWSSGLLWNNLRELPYFLTANLGTEPIGWADTPMPRIIWMSTLAAFFGLALWGIGRMDRWKALSLASVLAGLLGVPYLLLWRGGYPVGFEIQARYVLPLVPVLGFTLLYWRRATSVSYLTAVQLSTVLGLMTVAHSVALHSNIRRYVTGVGNLSIDLDAGREWWWDIPVTPNMVWVSGSMAFGLLAALLGLAIRAHADLDAALDDDIELEPEGAGDLTYA
jgi:hypothetical protein